MKLIPVLGLIFKLVQADFQGPVEGEIILDDGHLRGVAELLMVPLKKPELEKRGLIGDIISRAMNRDWKIEVVTVTTILDVIVPHTATIRGVTVAGDSTFRTTVVNGVTTLVTRNDQGNYDIPPAFTTAQVTAEGQQNGILDQGFFYTTISVGGAQPSEVVVALPRLPRYGMSIINSVLANGQTTQTAVPVEYNGGDSVPEQTQAPEAAQSFGMRNINNARAASTSTKKSSTSTKKTSTSTKKTSTSTKKTSTSTKKTSTSTKKATTTSTKKTSTSTKKATTTSTKKTSTSTKKTTTSTKKTSTSTKKATTTSTKKTSTSTKKATPTSTKKSSTSTKKTTSTSTKKSTSTSSKKSTTSTKPTSTIKATAQSTSTKASTTSSRASSSSSRASSSSSRASSSSSRASSSSSRASSSSSRASSTSSSSRTSSSSSRTSSSASASATNDGTQIGLKGLTYPLQTQSLFIEAMLQQHNYMRARHGVVPLTWNATLADAAYLRSSSGKWAHTPNNPFGENIAMGGYNDPLFYVYMFYDEVKNYDFVVNDYVPGTGHFTQIVWKDTRQVGCSMVNNNPIDGFPFYLTCEYNPPGNWLRQFGKNVLPANDMPYPNKPSGWIHY